MPKGFEINKRGIRQMTRALEKEFARNPIRVPVESSYEETSPATDHVSVGGGVDFGDVPEETVPRLAVVEATMVLLLEMEERGPDERGVDPSRQWLEQNLHRLDEPLRSWAQEHARELTAALTRDHLLANKIKTLGGSVESRLSERGRKYAARLRVQRSGRGRRAAVNERVLGLVGHADDEGRARVDAADLAKTAAAWVAGVKVTEEEADRAGRDLIRRGLIEAPELEEGAVCFARLTSDGTTVLETFDGSIARWEKSKAQGSIHVGDQYSISNSTGIQVANRNSGDVTQSAFTEVSTAPDLAQLGAQIRELVPELSLDESEREELIDQAGRLEGVSDNPQAQLRGVKRWLSSARDLLEGDSSGKAAAVVSALGSALVWCNRLLGQQP